MQDEALIRMTKQIAEFFAPYGEEETVSEILGHLNDFWDPRMRRQLIEIYEAAPERLDPYVRAAVAQLEVPDQV